MSWDLSWALTYDPVLRKKTINKCKRTGLQVAWQVHLWLSLITWVWTLAPTCWKECADSWHLSWIPQTCSYTHISKSSFKGHSGWYTPEILAFSKQKQENCSKFKLSLVYKVSYGLARSIYWDTTWKDFNKQKY